VQYFSDILGIGTPELVIVLVIILLLFGSTKLPALFRSVGSSMRELRKGIDGKGDHEDAKKHTQSRPTER
jgi:sec-independent protein translocase protein TatA